MAEKLTRRAFLRATAVTAAGAALIACQPKTVVVKETVVVEKEKEVTKIVEKEKEVTKVVEKEVEKVVTATPVVMMHKEAPTLAGLVQQGKLPPVDERVSADPLVITPVEEVGDYGRTWHRLATSYGDVQVPSRLSYEHLVRYNIDGTEVVLNVAQGWEVSPDGKQFTFKLRKGMKWSDGEPYTADDIVFYYEDHLMNEELTPTWPAWLRPGGERVKIEKVDDYTVRFVFGQPYGLFMALMPSAFGSPFVQFAKHYIKDYHANHVDKAELEKMAKDAGFEFWYQLYNDKRGTQNYVGYPVVYAWVCTVSSPKQPMVSERNSYYWKVDTSGNQLPYIDRIEHMLVEGKDMLNLRAAAGEVDMQLRHITIINYPIFQDSKEKGDYRVLMWSQAMATDAALAINLTNKDPVLREIVADKRFRWALSLGINRDEIIQSAYLGMAEPSQVAPTPSSPYYWEEQAKNLIEYDPDRANKLLDEMGLTEKDGEGYRVRPDGKRLTIIFEYAPVFGSWGDIGELLTAHWKKLGIELVPKEIARQLMYERKAASEHDMGMWTGSGEFNPLIDPRWFIPFSDESIHAGQYAAWWNTGGKEGEEPTGDLRTVLELYDQIKVTVDPEEQKKLFRQILEMNKENLWVIGICTPPPQPVIVKNDFRNVPEHGASDWQLKTPGSTAPEQYFFKQD